MLPGHLLLFRPYKSGRRPTYRSGLLWRALAWDPPWDPLSPRPAPFHLYRL